MKTAKHDVAQVLKLHPLPWCLSETVSTVWSTPFFCHALELARILRSAILDRLDPYVLEAVIAREDRERARLVDHVSGFLESLR